LASEEEFWPMLLINSVKVERFGFVMRYGSHNRRISRNTEERDNDDGEFQRITKMPAKSSCRCYNNCMRSEVFTAVKM
jgi:hypothetical protein